MFEDTKRRELPDRRTTGRRTERHEVPTRHWSEHEHPADTGVSLDSGGAATVSGKDKVRHNGGKRGIDEGGRHRYDKGEVWRGVIRS